MTWWAFDDVREVETVCGCCSLVRKKAIEQVGLMDERYFVYGDDPDWCYRFKKAGWKIMFTPEPRIIHYGGQTTQHKRREFRWQLHGSELIFTKIHKNWLEFILARLFMAMFLLLRVPYWFTVALLNKDIRNKAMETTGTYLIGGILCLFNWKQLLINKQALDGRL
jgi:GT2 family glycosyltransferase